MKNYDYTKNDIKKALIDVGIKKGDSIFVHSNIGFFGRLKDVNDVNDYCRSFKEVIFDLISESGTLVVPSFSYSFCKKEHFNKKDTPSVCGIFSEFIRKDKSSLRSDDANFSVAAIGKNMKYFTNNVSEYSFGKDSFWDRFLRVDGKFCNFNFDAASTFLHYVERELNVSYRFDKKFTGCLIDGDKTIEKFFYHFCYDLNKKEDAPEFSRFDKKARNLGLAKVSNLGRGQIVSITARNTYDLIKKELQKDLGFITKGSSNIELRYE